MTKDEARIVILEDLLESSRNTIVFLDRCLNGEASYGYPEFTTELVDKINDIIGQKFYCPHSNYHAGCKGCQWHKSWMIKYLEAKGVLKNADL